MRMPERSRGEGVVIAMWTVPEAVSSPRKRGPIYAVEMCWAMQTWRNLSSSGDDGGYGSPLLRGRQLDLAERLPFAQRRGVARGDVGILAVRAHRRQDLPGPRAFL